MSRSSLFWSSRVAAALLMTITACTAGSTTAGDVPTTEVGPTTTTPATASTTLGVTTTIAPGAAPPELSGTWVTEFGGETLGLTLRGTMYQATTRPSPDTGTGQISVEGDTIEFHSSDRCPDDPGGTYTWVIEGETLTFTLVGEDPCGRRSFLDGGVYTLEADIP